MSIAGLTKALSRGAWADLLEDISQTTDEIEVPSAVWHSPEAPDILLINSNQGWIASLANEENMVQAEQWLVDCGLDRQAFKSLGELSRALHICLDLYGAPGD